MKHNNLTALIFSAALLLTACKAEKASLSPYEQYSHTADNFGSEIVMSTFAENFGSANVMSAENSEKFRAAVSDIRINNSRIALPVLVCDLPEGFLVQYGKGERFDNDYMYFEGELIFGGERLETGDGGAIIKGGEKLADLTILKGSGMSETEGVIFSMTISSDTCKWSVGEADICSPTELERIFGTPSAAENLSDENIPDLFYVSDSGEFARFMPYISAVMITSPDCTRLEENKALCEYVQYKDFDNMTDLPPLTGEKKKFEGSSVLSAPAVTIGDISCQPLIPVNSLDGDMGLILRETAPIDGTDNIYDQYILLYKGRYFGEVRAMRDPDLPAEDGVIYAWYLTAGENLPCDASLGGIPVSQDTESLAAYFENSELKEDGSLVMYDICEVDGQEFCVFYSRSSGVSALITEPVSN